MKKFLYIAAALIALLLIIPVFLPSQISMSREIGINAAPTVVFDIVADYNYYLKWNPWSEMEPAARTEMGGMPKEPGHYWHWEGKELGTGTETIVKVEPGSMIETKLEFIEPMEDVASAFWKFEQAGTGTKVTWTYKATLGYPVGRYFGLMLEGMLGPQYEKGLKNIKTFAESMPADSAAIK